MPVAIVCYHGVVEEVTNPLLERNFTRLSHFREQLKFLHQFCVIGLSELENELAESNEMLVAITVDDGHINNLLMHDILIDAQLPWSSFIPTGAVGNLIWTTEIALYILLGKVLKIEIFGHKWSLVNWEEREEHYHIIRNRLKKLPASDRETAMEQIRNQFPDPDSLLEGCPSMKMMTWQDISMLKDAGVTIGSHGVNHEIHHALQPRSLLHYELQESKTTIEKKLGHECRYFALPNGNYTRDTGKWINNAGYLMGFTTEQNLAQPSTNQYLLPRISPNALYKFLS